MERREFIKNCIGASVLVLGAGTLLEACGDNSSKPLSSSGSTPPPSTPSTASACETNGTLASVPSDSLHGLTVSKEDVTAGVAKSYHIQGQQNHDHIVTLTADDFLNLKAGNGIQEVSTVTLGHRHTVVVSCAA